MVCGLWSGIAAPWPNLSIWHCNSSNKVAGSKPTKVVCITVLTGNRLGWTVCCGRPPLLLPSCRELEFRLSALMDSDLAWVNGKSGRQSWCYADAFQRSIISGAIYHFNLPTASPWNRLHPRTRDLYATALVYLLTERISVSGITRDCFLKKELWERRSQAFPLETIPGDNSYTRIPMTCCLLVSSWQLATRPRGAGEMGPDSGLSGPPVDAVWKWGRVRRGW